MTRVRTPAVSTQILLSILATLDHNRNITMSAAGAPNQIRPHLLNLTIRIRKNSADPEKYIVAQPTILTRDMAVTRFMSALTGSRRNIPKIEPAANSVTPAISYNCGGIAKVPTSIGTRRATQTPCSLGSIGFPRIDIIKVSLIALWVVLLVILYNDVFKKLKLKMVLCFMAKLTRREILKRARHIELIVLDVDGVLTDGKIIYSSDGAELKNFDVKDGHGIVMARDSGVLFAIVSGRKSDVTRLRARDLKIKYVYQNIKNKKELIQKLVDELNIDLSQVAFVGDDVIDIPAMQIAGIGVAVADAHPETLRKADWVTTRKGGNGAVREFVDLIIKAKS